MFLCSVNKGDLKYGGARKEIQVLTSRICHVSVTIAISRLFPVPPLQTKRLQQTDCFRYSRLSLTYCASKVSSRLDSICAGCGGRYLWFELFMACSRTPGKGQAFLIAEFVCLLGLALLVGTRLQRRDCMFMLCATFQSGLSK